jgi:predicted DNA-binding protein
MDKEKEIRTTVRIPVSLHEAGKKVARRTDQSFSRLYREAIREKIEAFNGKPVKQAA